MKQDLVKKLWDITNLITGFSAAQTLAFLLVALQGEADFSEALEGKDLQFPMAVGVALGTVAYLVAIALCYKGICKLSSQDDEWGDVEKIYEISTLIKIATVGTCGILTIVVIH